MNFKFDWYLVQPHEYASLRMRGIPFSAKTEDLIYFFKGYDMFEDSVKIGRNSDNTKTGEAAILFKTEAECKRAFQQR